MFQKGIWPLKLSFIKLYSRILSILTTVSFRYFLINWVVSLDKKWTNLIDQIFNVHITNQYLSIGPGKDEN